mmetsp:Transcript_49110/g.147862  ORF Transcript_49110/g.147862 Transcript_49110/m.147862 type:complete len:123 (+) Transcript_49110:230-598(+)
MHRSIIMWQASKLCWLQHHYLRSRLQLQLAIRRCQLRRCAVYQGAFASFKEVRSNIPKFSSGYHGKICVFELVFTQDDFLSSVKIQKQKFLGRPERKFIFAPTQRASCQTAPFSLYKALCKR